ncbi:MAG TPA: valine--tRNA ligase [Pseudonocardiaceae bacterium]|nr:valine--tRNA ligase [Pseudonocardiaceae bacterium]
MTEKTPATTHAHDLPPKWNPAEVEGVLYQRWVDAGYFTADVDSDKPPFTIVIPPPNVTSSLHIGHAFEHSLIDAVTRRKRMQGCETLWLPGMDHASIAVHALVEKQLADEGTDRREMGREAFVERVWQWKNEHGGKILGQMRRLGDGVDWTREAFTLDEQRSRAVQAMFKRLYDDGLIYRAERLVNWSPALRSGLSDAEVEHKEVEGELVSMRYGAADDSGPSIVVATTRVETMLGDTAVAVHPDDERYAAMVGTEIELPLTGRKIPIIADKHVDPKFGTGAVKVTPAHDPNDFEIGQRHNLPMPTIMDEQGRIADTGTEFDGLDRFEARVAIREALRAQGRIVAEKRPYLHSVGHSERGNEPIEPRLSLQWFLNVDGMAKAAGDAVRSGEVAINPPELAKRYFDWVDNLHDWCISRQLWWGHRIPVWYGPNGEMVCLGPDDEAPAGEGWRQDEDVLDTWFSSGLWPFATLGWPEQTPDLARFYPTSVLITGYDILFFWVIRMMMFGIYGMEQPPFRTIALHGMVRDQYGKKMSKSRGNTVDPLLWVDQYGADALRFTLLRGANPGADVPVNEEWVDGSRRFGTKLWNATRFALSNGATVADPVPAREELTDADRWILDRTDALVSEVDGQFENFEFAKLSEALYHFVWDEFCDWYLELAKVQIAEGEARAAATRPVLGHVLDVVLRLLHPLTPFITESLWTTLTGQESLVVADWPTATGAPADATAAARIDAVQRLVTEIRRFRSDQGIKPGQAVRAQLSGGFEVGISDHERAVRVLARLDEPGEAFAPTASIEVALPTGTMTVRIDTSGAIDVAAERKRLAKDLAAAQKELGQTQGKLDNPKFTSKAPAEVVAKIEARKQTAVADIDRITAALAALPQE